MIFTIVGAKARSLSGVFLVLLFTLAGFWISIKYCHADPLATGTITVTHDGDITREGIKCSADFTRLETGATIRVAIAAETFCPGDPPNPNSGRIEVTVSPNPCGITPGTYTSYETVGPNPLPIPGIINANTGGYNIISIKMIDSDCKPAEPTKSNTCTFTVWQNNPIPSFTTWGLIVLVALILVAGIFLLVRRRKPVSV